MVMVMLKSGKIKILPGFVVLTLILFLALDSLANPGNNYSYNCLTLNYLNKQNISVPFAIASNKIKNFQQEPVTITCPNNISTYTDLNSCTSYISGILNVQYPENSLVRLTWEMTGASTDASESAGINQINEYEFNEGITTVTYTAEDLAGNISSCSFSVTITDNQVPRLEAIPGDITVQIAPGECSAPASWHLPVASDNCTPTSEIIIEGSAAPGSVFPVGETTVYYHAYDAMGNQSATHSFTVTVKDNEFPQLVLPDEVSIKCEEAVPPSWQNLQDLFNAGGFAADNCEIDASSFHLLSETSDAETCPFTITRTYEVSDIHGNKTSAQYLIHVAAPAQGTPVLKSGTAEITALGGNWSAASTWPGGIIPGPADDVIIPAGVTVTIDAAAFCNNITIESGGTLNYSGAYSLQVNGNWTNNGTYNGGTSGVVEFSGNTAATINGNTTFEELIVSKGNLSSTLTITGNVTVNSGGSFTFNSGLITIGSGGSLSIDPSNGITIPETAGFDVTGGTLTTGNFSITNNGLIRVTSGTANLGTNSGNTVHTQVDGAFIVTNGNVNIAGRLENTASGTLNPPGVSSGIHISGGTVTLATAGNGLSNVGSLNVTSAGTFDFSGGIIVFQTPSTAATELDLGLIDGNGTKNTTGGTFQFGNGSTPAGATFDISSEIPLDNITSASGANLVLNSDLLVNQLNLNSGSSIDLSGNALQIAASGLTTYNFPLDDGNGNAIPVIVNLTSGSNFDSGDYIGITTAGSIHPQNANNANFLNRYWTVTINGISNPSYSINANYSAGDIANAATNLIVGNYTSSWNEITGATIAGNTVSFSSTSTDLSFSILEEPTVTITNTTNPEVICDGSSVTLTTSATGDPGLTYLWSSNPSTSISANTGSSVTVAPPANPSNSITNYTYTVTVTDGNGFSASDNIGVTVNPVPGVTASSLSETICSGDAPNITLTSSVIGTVFNWTVSQTGVTGASSGTGNTISEMLNATGTTQGTASYTIIPSANGCNGNSITVTITVDPTSEPGTASADQTICNGDTPADISLSGYTGNIQWQSSPDNSTWTNIGGATSATLTSAQMGALTATTYYRAQVTSGTCPPAYSNSVTITVNTPPTFTNCPASNIALSTDPGICTTTGTYTVAATGTPAPTYTYEFTGDTNDSGNGTGSGSTFNKGTTNVKVTATNSCGSAECNFTIIVTDNEAPVKPTLNPIFESCEVTLTDHPAPTTTDNCDGEITGTTTTSFPITTQGITTIIWTFTDSEGNSITANQVISIEDDASPTWDDMTFFNSTLNMACDEDTTVTGTGIPTASDNCGPVTITYSTDVPSKWCPGRYTIERTWTATDAVGNKNTKVQTISVNDNEAPVINCKDTTVANKDAVFDPFGLNGITFSDNCGIDTVFLVDEWFTINSGVSGFCPDEVYREYTIYDKCGNTNSCTQKITVASTEGCDLCQESVPKFLVDLNGAPDSTWVLDDKFLTREGACCQTADGNSAWGCISFNVYLDENAVGLYMDIANPAPPGKSEYYKIDCSDRLYRLDSTICLAGGQFYTLTFCKPGEDKPIYTIQSISGAVVPDSLTTRADVECFGDLHVGGLEPGTINWTVEYPAGADTLIKYLSDPYSADPVFTPDAHTPPLIKYKVSGVVAGFPECDGQPIIDDAIVVVNVLPPIKVNLDVDLTTICENEIPPIHAQIPNEDPNLEYDFKWYNGPDGPDGPGTVVSTDPNYQPTEVGTYSVLVTEVTSGVGCNRDVTNFNIAYDLVGPSVLAPPDTLFLDCSATDFDTQVVNWIATAEAHDLEDPSLNITVHNDYTYMSPTCGLTQIIHFWAEDNCGNISRDSAVIYVQDDIAPVMTTEASDANSDCAALDPNTNSGYLAWLANHGGATATDDCDNNLDWTDNSATQTWSGDPANNQITITFTATDDCGNTAQTTATYSIIDDIPPTITCPDNIEEQAALNNCSKTLAAPTDPMISDVCSTPTLTYLLEFPDGTTSTGTGTVTGLDFPVGVTTVTYTATDAAGLSANCSFTVTIVDVTPPNIDIDGCKDITESAAPNNCSKVPTTLQDPAYDDICWPLSDLVLTYTITGATTGSGTGSVVGLSFNVGVSTVEYTVTDPDGNSASCSFTVTILDITSPNIDMAGCTDVTETMGPNDCYVIPTNINDPTFSDACWPASELALTYNITGATTGSGSGSVSGVTFNLGVSTVEYTVTDPDGNTATCSFTVTILRSDIPPAVITCPANPAPVNAEPNVCEAYVTMDAPVISDPCATATFTMVNDYNGTNNASDTYPVGITTVTWTITDNSGNLKTCEQTVEVIDNQPPTLACPADVEDLVTNGGCDMTSGSIGEPTFSDNCPNPVLTYTIVYPDGGTANGNGSVSALPFPVGKSTVTYTVTDASGLSTDCSFTVWIKNLDAPQFSVTCPTDVTASADAGECGANLNPPVPVINNPCGETYTVSNDWPDAIDSMNINGTYPVGITTIHWTITDASGNVTTCEQNITVTDDEIPTITCPPNAEDEITNGGCDMISSVIGQPTFDDNCGIESLTYTLSGATTGSSATTGINYADGESYNAGITTVTYVVTDVHGNTNTCSHTIWMKNLTDPQFSVTCPADVVQDADAGECYGTVSPPVPVINNPCNEAYTVTNDWPYAIDSMNIDGQYPIGTTTIIWTITDASGNVTTCEQHITVNDLLPTLTCPSSITVQADYEQPFASGISVGLPTFDDNCPDSTLIYTVTAPSGTVINGTGDPSGINILTGAQTYELGVTVIEYTFTDAHGHEVSCSFTVTVLGKPVIECPPTYETTTDPGVCTATRNSGDFGLPTLIEGVQPITWTWTIFDPDGNEQATGTFVGSASDPGPPAIPDQDFQLGTSTISWRAENVSGYDECSHLVIVTEEEPPTFTTTPFENCVDMLHSAVFTSTNPNPNAGVDPNLIKNPSPDFYTFDAGNTALDLTNLADNCCDPSSLTIHWKIDFTDTPDPLNPSGPPLTFSSISGTGQPSAFGSDMHFPGDGVYFTNVTHTITYWVEDCNGNTSDVQVEDIVITPRPEIVKQTKKP